MTEAFFIMLRNVLVFVLLAVPGFLLVKLGLIKDKESGVLSKLLTYVGVPFLVLSSSLNISFDGEIVKNILIVALVGVAFTVGIFFLSALATKPKEGEDKKRGMARFCMMFSNNGFLGIPLAQAVFGPSLVLTYLIILNIVTNLLIFTLGVYLISGDRSKISLKKALLTPVLISFVVAIVLNLLKVVDYVPEVGTYASHFSNLVTPLSMIILGIKMAGVKFKDIFSKGSLYFVSVGKLLVVPALAVLLTFLLKWAFGFETDIIVGFFIAFAMPTAGLSSTLSDRYDGDTENAVAYTLGTTLFSIVTIPLLYWLLLLLI